MDNLKFEHTLLYNKSTMRGSQVGKWFVNGGILEEVEQFCYLGDVLECEGVVERAMRARDIE